MAESFAKRRLAPSVHIRSSSSKGSMQTLQLEAAVQAVVRRWLLSRELVEQCDLPPGITLDRGDRPVSSREGKSSSH